MFTQYVPAPWLKKGANEIEVLEEEKPRDDLSIAGLREPILDEPSKK